MAVTLHEKDVISRFVSQMNAANVSSYNITSWPDASNRSSKDIDAIAEDHSHVTLGIEHTLLQPFEGERRDTSIFLQTVATLDKQPNLAVAGFEVSVAFEVGAVDRGVEWSTIAPAVAVWYLNHSAHISTGRTSHIVSGLPFELRVVITKKPTSYKSVFLVERQMPDNSLSRVIEKALTDKLPKLAAANTDRRILLFEQSSIVVDGGSAAEYIESVRSDHPLLESIDEIWSIKTAGLESEGYTAIDLMWPLGAAIEFDERRNPGA